MSENNQGPAPMRRLPEHPNLEQLRRRAKELLEQFIAGDPAAVAEVRQFERSPNASSFALSDAQRVLARSYGHASWPKLKAFVDGANVARFIQAVRAGDLSQVRVLLAACPELVGMDVSASNEHRGIHYAVLQRDAAMVRLLMEAGSDAHKGIWPHRDATSALHLAREREYGEIVAIVEEEERLRREEMSCPNATISPVQDQIGAAIVQGDDVTAMRLLEADRTLIQACDREGATPLHLAAQEGNAELVAWLLKRRANVRKQDLRGLTALDRAALAADPQSFPAIVRLLLEHGGELTIRAAIALADVPRIRELLSADPDLLRQNDWRGGLLTLAVRHDRLEIVRLLLDLGADVDERTVLRELEEPTPSWGMPLWSAALANRFEIAKLLLDCGADPNANVYASGWPLGHAWNHPDGALKRLLLERGATLQPHMIAVAHNVDEAKRLLATNPQEEVVRELLWSAAASGCPAIVELALAFVKWPAEDKHWHWVLIQPIRGAGGNSADNEGHLKSMALLLQHGIDPNISRFGQTALHFLAARPGLCERDLPRFASLLLDHGADLNVRDELLKSTPLGWACRWGRKELVEFLIARGAPIDEPDAEPWAAPKAWARKMDRELVLAILQQP